MIRAVGTDLVDVTRLEGYMDRVPGLRERLFTPAELSVCRKRAASLGALDAVIEVRGRGLLRGLGLADGVGPAAQVVEDLAQRGFIINAPRTDTLRLAPPFILSDADADAFTGALSEVLARRLQRGAP